MKSHLIAIEWLRDLHTSELTSNLVAHTFWVLFARRRQTSVWQCRSISAVGLCSWHNQVPQKTSPERAQHEAIAISIAPEHGALFELALGAMTAC